MLYSQPVVAKKTVAVIGAGPVGISAAYALVNNGFSVVLIEAGHFSGESDHLTIDNYIFESRSLMPHGCHKIGGGANYWIGRIGEFLPFDFENLSADNHNCWPLNFTELEKYYKVLFEYLGEDHRRDQTIIQEDCKKYLKLLPENLDFRLIRYGKKDFFLGTLEFLLQQKMFQIYESTLCLKIGLEKENDLEDRYVLNLKKNNHNFTKKVDKVIVACGALESPRLLLSSHEILSDQVVNNIGKGLMEHFDGFVAKAHWNRKTHRDLLPNIVLNRFRTLGSSRIGLGLKLSEEIRKNESLINLHLEFVPETRSYCFDPILRPKNNVNKTLYLVERVVKKIFSLFMNQLRVLNGKRVYSVWVKAEEISNKHSLVSVTKESEQSHKIVYNHKVSNESRSKFIESLNRIQYELNRQKVCELKFDRDVVNQTSKIFDAINWHPMGTLKMALSEQSGVCDENLKVFGTKGIYITDASVFPTGSNANPTSTAIALAFRLADHLLSESLKTDVGYL